MKFILFFLLLFFYSSLKASDVQINSIIVLENNNGMTHYYQNDANVITNSPTFPEHIQELKKFVKIIARKII